MTLVITAPGRLDIEELVNMEDILVEAPSEIQNSFTVAKEYYQDRVKDLCREGVADAAAFLDEHVLGWAGRITRPLNMDSVHDCVLGQVFDPKHPDNEEWTEPRFFGLIPSKKKRPASSNGFIAGCNFLIPRGYVDRPFVFSSYEAAPFWRAEISRRSTA